MIDGLTWSAMLPGPMMAVAALSGGAALGVVFFGGLWWTLRRGLVSTASAGWFLGSLIVRSGIVLAGLWVIGSGQPVRLALGLAGFTVARAVVLRTLRPSGRRGEQPLSKGPPCA